MLRIWKRNRARRILPGGWVFTAMFFGVLIAAWNTGTSLLYIVGSGLSSFILLSLILARWNLRNIHLSCEAPYAVHRGEPLMAGVRIENRKWLMPTFSVRIENSGDDGGAAGYLLHVPAQRAAELNISHVFARRGVQHLPPFSLVTAFPFGLMEHRRVFMVEHEVVVYPKITAVRASYLEQAAGGNTVARAASSEGDEFFSLREYLPGDDLRRIVWRISARLGKWMVREMSSEGSRNVIIALDTRASFVTPEDEERFEECVELTASIAIMLVMRQYCVSIITPDTRLEPGDGAYHQRRVLELLARVQPVAPSAFTGFDGVIAKICNGPDRLLCLSPDPARWGTQAGSGRQHILDPRELIHA